MLHNQLSSRESRYISINRIDKSLDAYILIKLTNKFGIIRNNKFGATVRGKLKNLNQIDAAFVEWIQCMLIAFENQIDFKKTEKVWVNRLVD